MTLHLSAPRTTELNPRITVFGVGGAGGNAVNNMIDAGVMGCDFIVANTDAQALQRSKTDTRIQLGADITQGLGAGAQPQVGQQAAEESMGDIEAHLEGTHMVFVTAGMGGGTGTGAAPVIAQCARDKGILTVGVVTKPFQFEGGRRMKLAESGISELQKHVDTLIIIPNQNLFRIANERTTFAEAFGMADEVLCSGVRSITDLMVMPGLINLDFADVRTVMSEMGKAMMGSGEAEGERRAVEAAQAAINNPLLDEVSMKGAKGVLINITGGYDLTLYEVDEAANEIRSEVDPDANIIVGSSLDENMEGTMRVSVVATGIESEVFAQHEPEKPIQRPAQRPTVGWRPPAMAQAQKPTVHDMQAEVAARLSHEVDETPQEPAHHEAEDHSQHTEPQVATSHHQPEAPQHQAHADHDVPSMPRHGQEHHQEHQQVQATSMQAQSYERPHDHEAKPQKKFSLFGWGKGKVRDDRQSYTEPADHSVRVRETHHSARQDQQTPHVEPTPTAPQPEARTPSYGYGASGPAAAAPSSQPQTHQKADLFADQPEDDDVVDIPAFLRR